MDFGSKKPLHLQSEEMAKAFRKNPSYESFRPNIHLQGGYNEMKPGDRADIPEQFRIRRYPNGMLDFMWTANQIIDAIHKLEYNGTTGDPNRGSASLLPIECALLTVVFPGTKYEQIDPMQATTLAQLSESEKDKLRMIIEKQLADEDNWNAGFGGGSDPGSRPRNVGG